MVASQRALGAPVVETACAVTAVFSAPLLLSRTARPRCLLGRLCEPVPDEIVGAYRGVLAVLEGYDQLG